MHENGIHDYMKWIKFGYGLSSMRKKIFELDI